MGGKSVPPQQASGEEQRLPLMEEHATLDKARVLDSRISIERTTTSAEELLETELAREEVEIEHIAKNQPVEDGYSAEVRYEGEVMIIPVIEEHVEIIRRRVLKEEVHIRKVKKVEPYQQKVLIRSQEVKIRKEKGKP